MKRMVSCIACSMMVLSLSVVAQQVDPLDTGTTAPKESAQKVGFALTAGGAEQFNTDIDKGGSFSLFRGRIGAAVPVRLNDSLSWDTQGKYQFDAYNFSKTVDLWGTINTLQAVSLLKWQQSERWAFYGGGMVRFAVEDSTDLAQGFTAGGLGGFNYTVNSNLTLGAGAAFVGQMADSTKILPILTVNWKFAEDWRLTVGFLDVATSGYGAEVAWSIAPQWQISAGGQYHQARFRLNSSDIGQESAGTWYLRGAWKPNDKMTLSAFAGIVAGGGLRVENSNGRKLYDNNYDTTGMAGGEFSLRF